MQKEHRNIDELFKSKLSDFETPAPAFVKNGLTKKLFGNMKSIFLVIPLLTLFFGFSFFFFQNKKNTYFSNNDNIKLLNRIETLSQSTKKIKNESSSKKNQIHNQNKVLDENTNPIIYKEETSKSEFILGKKYKNQLTIEETLQNMSLMVNEKNKSISTQLIIDSIDKNTTDSNNEEANKNYELNKALPNQNIIETSINENETIKETDSLRTNISRDYTENQASHSTSKSTIEIDSLNEGNIIGNNKHTLELDSTTNSSLMKDSIQLDLNNTSNPKKSSFLISLSSGVNISKSIYSSINPNDANYYKSNNTDKLNIEHNLTANFVFKNNFLVASGIGINKQRYNYTYIETSTYNITTVDTSLSVTYIYGQNDSLQEFPPTDTAYSMTFDTTTNIAIKNTPYQGDSRAEYIHIPLQLGYVWNLNKFMFGIQANIRYNILYKTSGEYYINGTVNDFDKSNSIFKKSYFDFALKTDIYYNIFNQVYLNGSIKYVPSINNTYQNLEVERKLNYLHFGFGLSYKL
jgi:hypothetical protein